MGELSKHQYSIFFYRSAKYTDSRLTKRCTWSDIYKYKSKLVKEDLEQLTNAVNSLYMN